MARDRIRLRLHYFMVGLALVSVAGHPAAAMAQVTDEHSVADILEDLESSQWIRVGMPQDSFVRGRFEGSSPLGLSLSVRSARIEIPYARIDSLWFGRRDPGNKVLLGSLIGAALGTLTVAVGSDLSCEAVDNRCSGAPASTWALGIAGGAAIGAGIGALIGSGSLGWELAFP